AYCNGIIVSAYTIKTNVSIKEILFAVNATNGKILWCIDEGCTKIPPNLESPPPTIFNGVVYHDSPVGILYAVNLTSGKIIWAFKTGFTVDNPEIYEGKIIIQNASGYLFVLSYQGNLLKGFQTPVMPGPGNMLLTCNSLILVGVNGIVDSLPLYCLT
ncbi:MAG: pyrrolo-quinoline quinone, partial [Acidianus sp.]